MIRLGYGFVIWSLLVAIAFQLGVGLSERTWPSLDDRTVWTPEQIRRDVQSQVFAKTPVYVETPAYHERPTSAYMGAFHMGVGIVMSCGAPRVGSRGVPGHWAFATTCREQ